jgi:hypothetical protein
MKMEVMVKGFNVNECHRIMSSKDDDGMRKK